MEYYAHMAPSNINFKLLSLNARGIRSFEERKALFGWLMKDRAEVEKIWKSQWKGGMFSRMVWNIVGVSSF